MPDDPYTIGDLARLADVTPRTVRYYLAQGLLPSPEPAGPATRYGEGHLARLRLIKRLQRDHLPLAEIRLRLERRSDEEIIATVSALESRTPEPSPDPNETLAFVRDLMARTGIASTSGGGAQGIALKATTGATLEEAWAAHPSMAASPARASAPAPSAPAPAPASTSAPAGPASDSTPAPTPASTSAPTVAPLPAPSAPERGATPGPAQVLRARRMTEAPAAIPPAPADAPRITPDRSTWERLVISPDVELHVRRPLDRRTNKRVDQLERIARELFEDD